MIENVQHMSYCKQTKFIPKIISASLRSIRYMKINYEIKGPLSTDSIYISVQ